MIAVIDYGKGNLQSVASALYAVGAEVCITDDLSKIALARALVLPGVGSFADAAASMEEKGLMQAIRERIDAGVAFLGICLGLHLMFEEGVEGAVSEGGKVQGVKGLSLIPGTVSALPHSDKEGHTFKIPHVGWNSLDFDSAAGGSNPLLEHIDPGTYFYFTHSFKAPDTAHTLATTTHSVVFPSMVSYNEKVFGVQFHPEKSSDAGAVLLRNFLAIAKGW